MVCCTCVAIERAVAYLFWLEEGKSPAEIYRELAKCWAFDPGQRPDFAGLTAFFLATGAQLVAPAHARAPHGRAGGGGGGFRGPRAAPAQGGAALHYDLGHQDNTGGGAGQYYTLRHQDAGADAGMHYNLGHQDLSPDSPLLLFEDGNASMANSSM